MALSYMNKNKEHMTEYTKDAKLRNIEQLQYFRMMVIQI